MKCWYCEKEFENYKRVPGDPMGNYCPFCDTFLKSDNQIEEEKPISELPEKLQARLIDAISDFQGSIKQLLSIINEIDKLPESNAKSFSIKYIYLKLKNEITALEKIQKGEA